MTAPQSWAPSDHVDGFDTWEDLPRDGRCMPGYWF